MTTPRKILPALLGVAALALAVVLPAAAAHDPGASVYKVEFEGVGNNEPSAAGGGTIIQKGAQIRVNVHADGLDAGTHLSHVHGLLSTNNTCPTLAADGGTVEDGFVDLAEGALAYGPILIDLMPSSGTAFGYSRTFDETNDPLGINPSGVPLDEIGSLEQFHIVVHGVDVDGDGDLDGQKDVNGDGRIGDSGNPVIDLTEVAFELSMPALCGDIVQNGK